MGLARSTHRTSADSRSELSTVTSPSLLLSLMRWMSSLACVIVAGNRCRLVPAGAVTTDAAIALGSPNKSSPGRKGSGRAGRGCPKAPVQATKNCLGFGYRFGKENRCRQRSTEE